MIIPPRNELCYTAISPYKHKFGVTMKRALAITGIVIALIVIVPAVGVVGYFVWYGIMVHRTYTANKEFLLKQIDHRAVATACFDLLTKPEYQAFMDQDTTGDDPKLPAAIQSLRAIDVVVWTNNIMIFKTGGFYHMGLVFYPSTSDSNRFILAFREEKYKDLEHDIPLYSVDTGLRIIAEPSASANGASPRR